MDLPPRDKDKPRQGISVELRVDVNGGGAECVVSVFLLLLASEDVFRSVIDH